MDALERRLLLDPAEHGADLLAGDLDGVRVDGLTLLEEPLVVVVAVVDELLGELAVLDATQDLLHGLAGLLVDDLRAGVVLAVLGGFGTLYARRLMVRNNRSFFSSVSSSSQGWAM